MSTLATTFSEGFERFNNAVFGKKIVPIASSPVSASDHKIASVMEQVLEAKKSHRQAALDNKLQRYNPIFIGGDIFTFGYLIFDGIQSFMPSLAGIAVIGTATLVCGVVAGVINIGVGVVSLKEAIQAFRNGDKVLGLRLMLDFFCCTAIGSVMILSSLAIKIGALGGIGAFLAANPWVLPVLFFIATIPLIVELSYRLKNIATSSDLGSQLKLNDLKELLQAEDPNWDKIDELYTQVENTFNLSNLPTDDDEKAAESLSKKMEELQADLGVSAGVEVFNLLIQIKKRNKKAALDQITIAEKKIKEWNRSLYLRMFQQMLYVVGFGVSMTALVPKVNGALLNGIQDFFLAGANAIPLYMDTFWPFKRNTPIVVPKVENEELQLIGKKA